MEDSYFWQRYNKRCPSRLAFVQAVALRTKIFAPAGSGLVTVFSNMLPVISRFSLPASNRSSTSLITYCRA